MKKIKILVSASLALGLARCCLTIPFEYNSENINVFTEIIVYSLGVMALIIIFWMAVSMVSSNFKKDI